MEINTDIAILKKPVNYIYTAKNLAINDISYNDGDATLTVPRFDSYVMFDFDQTDLNGQRGEVDLSGMGDAFLCFVGNNIDIKIKNLNNIENVNKGLGQVVFRISSDDARKIYGIQSNNFFITTKITQLNSSTEETIVYSGIWQKPGVVDRITYAELISSKEKENIKLNEAYDNLYLSFEKQRDIISNSSSILEEEKNKTILLNDSILRTQAKIEETRMASKFSTDTSPLKPEAPNGTPDPNVVSAVLGNTTSNEDTVTVINYQFFGNNGRNVALGVPRTKFAKGLLTLFSLIQAGVTIPKGDDTVSITISSNQYEKFLASLSQTLKLNQYYSFEFNSSFILLKINKKYKTEFLNILKINTIEATVEGVTELNRPPVNINCFLKEGIEDINDILSASNQSQITIN